MPGTSWYKEAYARESEEARANGEKVGRCGLASRASQAVKVGKWSGDRAIGVHVLDVELVLVDEAAGRAHIPCITSDFDVVDLLPTRDAPFCGGLLPVPRNSSKVLVAAYGPTWRERLTSAKPVGKAEANNYRVHADVPRVVRPSESLGD